MKTLLITLCCWVSVGALGQKIKRELESDLIPVSGPPYTVIVENLFGSVRIQAGNEGAISYKVEKEYQGKTEAAIAKAVSSFKLETILRNDSLILFVMSPCGCNRWIDDCEDRWGRNYHNPDAEFRFDFDLTVPKNTILEVSTVDNGELRIDGVTGAITANHVTGDVFIKGARDLRQAGSVSGDVFVYFESGPVINGDFKSISGEINLFFKDGSGAEVYSKTLSGGLFSAFDYVTLPSKVTKTEKKEGAGTTYVINNQSGISIGKNGPVLTMETISGNMYLRKL